MAGVGSVAPGHDRGTKFLLTWYVRRTSFVVRYLNPLTVDANQYKGHLSFTIYKYNDHHYDIISHME